MANDRAEPAEGDDRHDDQRLQVGPKLKCQQNVHAKQSDRKTSEHAGHRFFILGLLAFPVDRKSGTMIFLVRSNHPRNEFVLHFLNQLASINFVGVQISRHRNAAALIESIDFSKFTGVRNVSHFGKRSFVAHTVADTNFLKRGLCFSVFTRVADHQFDFMAIALQSHDFVAEVDRANGLCEILFVESQGLAFVVQLQHPLPFARAHVVFDVEHTGFGGQPLFTIFGSVFQVRSAFGISQNFEFDRSAARTHGPSTKLEHFGAGNFGHTLSPAVDQLASRIASLISRRKQNGNAADVTAVGDSCGTLHRVANFANLFIQILNDRWMAFGLKFFVDFHKRSPQRRHAFG